jgi:hypothetical protein
MLLERITALWFHALRDAEAFHARVRPGYRPYSDAELHGLIQEALRRHKDVQDLLAELFSERAPVSLSASRA